MIFNIFTKLITSTHKSNKILSKFYGIYEPDYLKLSEPKFPIYPPLIIRIRGYDYPILESYQGWISKIIKVMKFHLLESYGMPSKDMRVIRFKKNTTETEIEYLLKIYERNLKISEVNSISLPIFIRVLEAGLPEGVELHIDKHTPQHENDRYLIDEEIVELKEKIEKQSSGQ